jgi:hypothetical protein
LCVGFLLRELTEILPATPLEKSRLQTFRQSSAGKAVCGKKLEGTSFADAPRAECAKTGSSFDLTCFCLSAWPSFRLSRSMLISVLIPSFITCPAFLLSLSCPVHRPSFYRFDHSPTATQGFTVRAPQQNPLFATRTYSFRFNTAISSLFSSVGRARH